MFSLAKCKLNEYTAIMQFLVVSLRLPAIILAGFRFHFCASNVFKYTEEKLVKKKEYSFQFVFSGMTLMDILSFTDTGTTRLVHDLYS